MQMAAIKAQFFSINDYTQGGVAQCLRLLANRRRATDRQRLPLGASRAMSCVQRGAGLHRWSRFAGWHF